MNNGPLPSTLVLLQHLPSYSTGSKVRFLGCVTHYHLRSGTLSLQHAYPEEGVIAMIDVELLLESLKREDLEVGNWVNVVGYVEGFLPAGKKGVGEAIQNGWQGGNGAQSVRVKAVMLWGARELKIEEYEKATEGRILEDRRFSRQITT